MTNLICLIYCPVCENELTQSRNTGGILKSCRKCGFSTTIYDKPTVLKGTPAPLDWGSAQKHMAVWYLKSIGVTAEQYQQLLDELE